MSAVIAVDPSVPIPPPARAGAAGIRIALSERLRDLASLRVLGFTRREVPVRSPVRGRVLRIPEASERVVAASTPALELGDAAALEVIADVLSSDAVRIAPGGAVEFVDWGGDSPLAGSVRSVEPSAFTRVSALGVDEQRVSVIVDIVDPPAAIGDGFQVEMKATVWESSDVLTIPASGLFQRGGEWMVFVVRDGRARERHRTGAVAELKGGLREGDRVILFPSDKVSDGVRVRSRSTRADRCRLALQAW